MDKQKQIEEMAKDICGKYNNGGCEIDGWACTCKCKYYKKAENLCNAGYRKIPENAVVLTREEYEWLTCCFGKFEEIMNDIKKQARKETAERFAERVKMAFYYEFDELIPSIMSDKIDEICKELIEKGVQNGN